VWFSIWLRIIFIIIMRHFFFSKLRTFLWATYSVFDQDFKALSANLVRFFSTLQNYVPIF
jgi:hypothetical protein